MEGAHRMAFSLGTHIKNTTIIKRFKGNHLDQLKLDLKFKWGNSLKRNWGRNHFFVGQKNFLH